MVGLFASLAYSSYKRGNVRKGRGLRSPLTPPLQEGVEPNFWKVEKDILLYHFSSGKGAPVLIVHGGPGLPPLKPWKGLELLKEGFLFRFYPFFCLTPFFILS